MGAAATNKQDHCTCKKLARCRRCMVTLVVAIVFTIAVK